MTRVRTVKRAAACKCAILHCRHVGRQAAAAAGAPAAACGLCMQATPSLIGSVAQHEQARLLPEQAAPPRHAQCNGSARVCPGEWPLSALLLISAAAADAVRWQRRSGLQGAWRTAAAAHTRLMCDSMGVRRRGHSPLASRSRMVQFSQSALPRGVEGQGQAPFAASKRSAQPAARRPAAPPPSPSRGAHGPPVAAGRQHGPTRRGHTHDALVLRLSLRCGPGQGCSGRGRLGVPSGRLGVGGRGGVTTWCLCNGQLGSALSRRALAAAARMHTACALCEPVPYLCRTTRCRRHDWPAHVPPASLQLSCSASGQSAWRMRGRREARGTLSQGRPADGAAHYTPAPLCCLIRLFNVSSSHCVIFLLSAAANHPGPAGDRTGGAACCTFAAAFAGLAPLFGAMAGGLWASSSGSALRLEALTCPHGAPRLELGRVQRARTH